MMTLPFPALAQQIQMLTEPAPLDTPLLPRAQSQLLITRKEAQ